MANNGRTLGKVENDYYVVAYTWRGSTCRIISLGGWMTTAKKDTRKYSLDELRETRDRGETETRADVPALSLDAEFCDNAHVVMLPRGKSSIHLRIDSDVLEWFKAQGRGHLTRMNAVLRSFMEAHKQHRPR
jgi:uncharacterized protein (DUF4415 family)